MCGVGGGCLRNLFESFPATTAGVPPLSIIIADTPNEIPLAVIADAALATQQGAKREGSKLI